MPLRASETTYGGASTAGAWIVGCGGWTKGQGWAGYPGCGARTFTDPAGDLANTGTRAAHFYMGGGVSAFKVHVLQRGRARD